MLEVIFWVFFGGAVLLIAGTAISMAARWNAPASPLPPRDPHWPVTQGHDSPDSYSLMSATSDTPGSSASLFGASADSGGSSTESGSDAGGGEWGDSGGGDTGGGGDSGGGGGGGW